MHTSKRMHFIEDILLLQDRCDGPRLHTSKRMHFIEDGTHNVRFAQMAATLHTSKRMHFIEEVDNTGAMVWIAVLAYVKTYALH